MYTYIFRFSTTISNKCKTNNIDEFITNTKKNKILEITYS